MNETPERNEDEVNKPTASTWQTKNNMLYFFSAPLKGWRGEVENRVGSVDLGTASNTKHLHGI